MAIRIVNLNDSLASVKQLLSSYIRTDATDITDGMFSSVEDCTKTISSVSYTGVRANVLIGDTEVPAIEFYRLNNGALYVVFYYNSGSSNTYSQINNVTRLAYAYACDQGLMINSYLTADGSTWATVMITKGNDGYPFVVISNGGTHTSNVKICHVTDTNAITNAALTRGTTDYQNAMCPFIGYGDLLSVTHAPYAYFLVQSTTFVQNAGYSTMKFNGEIDGISNGYWVILEELIGGDDT